MMNDLINGVIDAAVLPYPFAIYFTSTNCKFLNVGQRFISDYFAIGFPINGNDTLYNSVNQANLELFNQNFYRNLENIYVLVASTGTCDYSADFPLSIYNFGGLWTGFIIAVVIGFVGAGIYKKQFKTLQKFMIGKDPATKSVDLQLAADLDLKSKFSKILKNSENKLIQRVKDIQITIQKSSSRCSEFKDTLASFEHRLIPNKN